MTHGFSENFPWPYARIWTGPARVIISVDGHLFMLSFEDVCDYSWCPDRCGGGGDGLCGYLKVLRHRWIQPIVCGRVVGQRVHIQRERHLVAYLSRFEILGSEGLYFGGLPRDIVGYVRQFL